MSIGGDLFWDNKLSRQKSPKGFFRKCESKKAEKKKTTTTYYLI